MKVYIRSSACISAQNTFNSNDLLHTPVEYFGTRLKTIEPDYRAFVDPKLLRRMSHVIKMGVATGQQCLRDAGVEMPGAIITGTAFGCMEDTIAFLTRLVEMNEEMLPPTPFIQSTHNTVAAQIALMLKCHNYNNTFVHKGISFESALQDALMLLNDGEANDILVGGIDEMIDTSFKVLTRLGLYKRKPISNLQLYNTPSKGTIGGEGAAFFLINDKPLPDNLAELVGLRTFFGVKVQNEIEGSISAFLDDHAMSIDNIDLIITGRNGDLKNDEIYDSLKLSFFKDNDLANYKHLCGDYSLSSSFAFWLAANILKEGVVPKVIVERQLNTLSPKTILIFNHYQGNYHSIILLSAC
jgi:3-oxoacyl-[acyl-carrier-protein] synthase II